MKFDLQRATLPVSVLVVLTLACAPAATPGTSSNRSIVTADDLAEHPDAPIEQVIQRKVPGVTVYRDSDGNVELQIRGASSLMGKPSPPLYVLNGLPVSPGSGAVLTSVDRHDIESIEVLKGADAALYGIDGANGVIIITTKASGARRQPRSSSSRTRLQ